MYHPIDESSRGTWECRAFASHLACADIVVSGRNLLLVLLSHIILVEKTKPLLTKVFRLQYQVPFGDVGEHRVAYDLGLPSD